MVMFPPKAKSEKYQVLLFFFMTFLKLFFHLTNLEYKKIKKGFIENYIGHGPRQSWWWDEN